MREEVKGGREEEKRGEGGRTMASSPLKVKKALRVFFGRKEARVFVKAYINRWDTKRNRELNNAEGDTLTPTISTKFQMRSVL
ncbi:hypothetical protein L3X38_021475 [Prunus dulcis]|uniref:Uncharacterized protein n=1 Tax=Prunus dulcis TaxID=3755 RepID=A0AAD4VU55_PRUDU|nr:hypothetical protein L3X38_021475 [Prunus dulcis]